MTDQPDTTDRAPLDQQIKVCCRVAGDLEKEARHLRDQGLLKEAVYCETQADVLRDAIVTIQQSAKIVVALRILNNPDPETK